MGFLGFNGKAKGFIRRNAREFIQISFDYQFVISSTKRRFQICH
jgi:hypothetical protein